MREEIFVSEARKCRNLALRYSGGPEQRLLVNLAAAFEVMARTARRDGRSAITLRSAVRS
jgi:hypothetical protein